MRPVFNMHKTVEKVLNELEKLRMMELVWGPNASPSHEVPELLGTDCVNMLRANEAIIIS